MYVRNSFWKQNNLTFQTPSLGYWDDDENYIEGSETITEIEGSLQPYTSMAKKEIVLPEGIKSEDAKWFLTRNIEKGQEIKVADEQLNTIPSYTIINGLEYYVQALSDWSSVGTNLKHYVFLLIKRRNDTLAEQT